MKTCKHTPGRAQHARFSYNFRWCRGRFCALLLSNPSDYQTSHFETYVFPRPPLGSKSLWVAPLEAFYVLYIFAKSVFSTFPLQSTTETRSFQTKKGPKIAQIFLNITDLTNYTIKVYLELILLSLFRSLSFPLPFPLPVLSRSFRSLAQLKRVREALRVSRYASMP